MNESEQTTTSEENETTTTDSNESNQTQDQQNTETTETSESSETTEQNETLIGKGKDGEDESEEESTFEDNTAESFTLPEGFELPEDRMGSIVEFTNKHQISPEVVNEFLALQGQWSTADAEAVNQAQIDAWNSTTNQWAEQLRADPVYGGEHLEGNLAKISDLIDTYTADKEGNPDKEAADQLRTAFNITGAGNHPAFLGFLTRLAEATLVEEGQPHPGGNNPTPQPVTGLYPQLDKTGS